MSYNIYTTEGFILNSASLGEADKQYSILTKDLGLILASAKSVRSEKTKLGGGLQDLSYTSVSLIRGKHRWKITSAVCLQNMFESLRYDKEKLSAFARVFKLVEMLIIGEEIHSHFFNVVESAVLYLKKTKLSLEEILFWESVIVLRILFNLGYCAKKEIYQSIFNDLKWDKEVLNLAETHKTSIIRDINRSLKATQLS